MGDAALHLDLFEQPAGIDAAGAARILLANKTVPC
jgi:hypothetical protein